MGGVCRSTDKPSPRQRQGLCAWAAAAILMLAISGFADEIEMVNGSRVQGQVVEKTAEFITFRFADSGMVARIPARNVRAVSINEKAPAAGAPLRETPKPMPTPSVTKAPTPTPTPPIIKPPTSKPLLVTPQVPKPTDVVPPGPTPSKPAGALQPSSTPRAGNTRTKDEVEALIAKAGTTPPDWWDSVALNYPPTLNLTWADPGKQWNAQRNLGQYIWDIINPNPPRWREGVKLLHHVLTVNKDDPENLERTAEALATMYHNLLQDWERAAFWWRKTAQIGDYDIEDFAIELSECNWKLGCKEMAAAALSPIKSDETGSGIVIKLWSDMGEIEKALELAELQARNGMPYIGYLAAGDACRLAGRYQDALAYYQKVLAFRYNPKAQGAGFIKRNQERARASIEAIKVFDALDLSRIPDGTYKSNSPAYAGMLHVAVVVKSGRIESVKVTQHQEKQFYSSITDTTRQIIEKQSVKGVDMTSGATMTAEAIVNATAKALASGMK